MGGSSTGDDCARTVQGWLKKDGNQVLINAILTVRPRRPEVRTLENIETAQT